jgi:hypothetical protein
MPLLVNCEEFKTVPKIPNNMLPMKNVGGKKAIKKANKANKTKKIKKINKTKKRKNSKNSKTYKNKK